MYSQNTQNVKSLLSTMPGEVKGTVFRENRMRGHKLAYGEPKLHIFRVIFKFKSPLRMKFLITLFYTLDRFE
jgi:hypothetical protein